MKTRLTTLDIVTLILELREKLVGLRVDRLYDIDKKTYLIRFSKTDKKIVLLIESGSRFHTTSFQWPKNDAPSGFTMKLRKHLNNKRLESITQIGADRVVDFQFGSEEFAVHLLLELYDRGNIILTDQAYNILSLVRPHIHGEDRLVAHEKYTVDKAKQSFSLTHEEMLGFLQENPGKSVREVLLPKIEFGPGLFTHVLKRVGLSLQSKIPKKGQHSQQEEENVEFQQFELRLFDALENGRQILESPGGGVGVGEGERGGFIVTQLQDKQPQQQQQQKQDKKKNKPKSPAAATIKSEPADNSLSAAAVAGGEKLIIYDQYHPMILATDFPEQASSNLLLTFPGFDETLDEFYSKIEAQKVDMKQLNQEKEAYKKLARVKDDQLSRLNELKLVQEVDREKGELIMFNQELIDNAIGIIRQLVANQIPWDDIWEQIREAQARGDPIASRITSLQLLRNQFKIMLRDPYDDSSSSPEDNATKRRDIEVEIDLDSSAYGNASKFFDQKKASAKKEERTLESQEKAFKSTEKKTLSTLREVATIQSIKKMRKIYWFEKFHWFISSENFLVIGGHDAQQNEMLVKRYMSPTDVYLHADSHGAPTIIIKNADKLESLPPKTLNEAGSLAVCASGSWESKIIATCWWVWGHQVSKSAPTGEYLPTGSFMIRGRKNYLPPCQLIMGFGFLFRLTDESVPNHKGERSSRDYNVSESSSTPAGAGAVKSSTDPVGEEEPELSLPSDDESDSSDSAAAAADGGDEDGGGLEEDEFPDTQVPVQLDKNDGGSRTRTMSTVSSEASYFTNSTAITDLVGGEVDNNYVIVQSGVLPQFSADASKPGKKKQGDKKKGGGGAGAAGVGGKKGATGAGGGGKDTKDSVPKGQAPPAAPTGAKSGPADDQQLPAKPKRGQHGRQKKLKEKYKFQDEDERELRMQLLQSKGKAAQQKGKQSAPAEVLPAAVAGAVRGRSAKVPPGSVVSAVNDKDSQDRDTHTANIGQEEDPELKSTPRVKQPEVKKEPAEPEEQQDQTIESLEIDILDSFTGVPLEQDELLFAIPVIAPYAALQNYKFRIKMIPGSTKRGKAAKCSMELFVRDKLTRQREKDLIKSVRDQDVARNFPGKVKLAGGATDKKK